MTNSSHRLSYRPTRGDFFRTASLLVVTINEIVHPLLRPSVRLDEDIKRGSSGSRGDHVIRCGDFFARILEQQILGCVTCLLEAHARVSNI